MLRLLPHVWPRAPQAHTGLWYMCVYESVRGGLRGSGSDRSPHNRLTPAWNLYASSGEKTEAGWWRHSGGIIWGSFRGMLKGHNLKKKGIWADISLHMVMLVKKIWMRMHRADALSFIASCVCVYIYCLQTASWVRFVGFYTCIHLCLASGKDGLFSVYVFDGNRLFQSRLQNPLI